MRNAGLVLTSSNRAPTGPEIGTMNCPIWIDLGSWVVTASDGPPVRKGTIHQRLLHFRDHHTACCACRKRSEDESDDHSLAEMGGETRPTGCANLFGHPVTRLGRLG